MGLNNIIFHTLVGRIIKLARIKFQMNNTQNTMKCNQKWKVVIQLPVHFILVVSKLLDFLINLWIQDNERVKTNIIRNTSLKSGSLFKR